MSYAEEVKRDIKRAGDFMSSEIMWDTMETIRGLLQSASSTDSFLERIIPYLMDTLKVALPHLLKGLAKEDIPKWVLPIARGTVSNILSMEDEAQDFIGEDPEERESVAPLDRLSDEDRGKAVRIMEGMKNPHIPELAKEIRETGRQQLREIAEKYGMDIDDLTGEL